MMKEPLLGFILLVLLVLAMHIAIKIKFILGILLFTLSVPFLYVACAVLGEIVLKVVRGRL